LDHFEKKYYETCTHAPLSDPHPKKPVFALRRQEREETSSNRREQRKRSF
jgi:hypothetical protein